MKYLILFFLSFNLYSAPKDFYCEARAILRMDFAGTLDEGELVSGITVFIEGTPFLVEREDVKEFWDRETSEGREFGFITEDSTGNWIDLNTLNAVGKVTTDYRGITLDDKDVHCKF